MRTVAAAVLIMSLAGCAEPSRAPLWKTFDLLVLAEDTDVIVYLFRLWY